MDFWSSGLVSLLLLASAAGLMVWHVRLWRTLRDRPLEPRELAYRRGQFRRRMQTSAMLGLLGVAIISGEALTLSGSRMFAGLYWGGVLLVVAWMALLALADMLATHQHFNRLRTEYLIERAKLQAEVQRIKAARSNGKPKRAGEKATVRSRAVDVTSILIYCIFLAPKPSP